MRSAVIEPANLVVLQPVTRAFHFDHPIPPLTRPELNEIGKTRAIRLHVLNDSAETSFEMRGRQAIQREVQQFVREQTPRNERRLRTDLLRKRVSHALMIFAADQ